MFLELTLICIYVCVVDRGSNANCTIVSTNLPNVTAAGGIIANWDTECDTLLYMYEDR